jgi:hypothetical protein
MKQFRQAILHVGTDKTGSTSIQRTLHAMREPLRLRKLAAYLPGAVHARFGSYFCAEPERCEFNRNAGIVDRAAIQARDRRYLAQAEDFLQSTHGCRSLIASFEGLMHLPDEALIGMRQWARRYADAVSVVMYVRHPHAYAISAMSQAVYMGRPPYIEGRIPLHNFCASIGTLIKIFGREAMIVRPVDAERLVSQDVVIDFLHVVGAAEIVGTPDYLPAGRENTSMSSTAMAFGGAFSRALLEAGLKLPAGEYRRRFGGLISELEGPSIKLTQEQAAAISEASRPGLAYLKKEFGIEFADAPAKYVSASEDRRSDDVAASIARVVAKMMVQQSIAEQAHGRVEVAGAVGAAKAGSEFKLDVSLFNESALPWHSSAEHPISIGYRFRGADGRPLPGGGRMPVPGGRLRSGGRCRVDLMIKAPGAAGAYDLEISLVHDRNTWLDKGGFTKYATRIDVT